MRRIAAATDDLFGTVIRDAMNVASNEDRMADSLEWVLHQAIFFAQHGDALDRVRREIEREENVNANRAVDPAVTTRPAGGSVISILSRLARKP